MGDVMQPPDLTEYDALPYLLAALMRFFRSASTLAFSLALG
jgi:hypothetical protein